MGPCTIVSVALLLASSALPIAELTCPGNRSPPPIWWRCQPAASQHWFRYYLFQGRNTSAADTSTVKAVPTMADFNTDCLRAFLTELAITGPFVAAGNQCFPPKACTATEKFIITKKDLAFTKQLIDSRATDFPECPPLNVTRGIITYPNGRRFFSNAKIICPEGYVLDSQKPVFCEHDGRWIHLLIDGTKLTAEIFNNKACIACSNQPVIQNGNIASCPGREMAEIQCNSGYTFSGLTTSLQFHNTKWTEPEGVCTKECPATQDINNGYLRIHDVRVNATAQVVCDTNSSINGVKLAICTSGGNWSIPDGACELKSCPNLNSSTNGMVSNGSNGIYTARAFTCQEGYQLKGSNITSCVSGQHGPEWLPDTPECVLSSCQDLILPANGMASNGSNEINSVRGFTCHDGFQLKGNNETSCVYGQHGPKWIPDTPECVPVHCQIPDDFSHRLYVISGTSVNSTLTIFCKRGTIAAGRPAVCGTNGTWSDIRLTSCDDTSPPMTTSATPVKSEQGDLFGYSGSIALIVIIACLVVALIISCLITAWAIRRGRVYKPGHDTKEVHPTITNKSFSGQPTLDQWNDGVNTPLGTPGATEATNKAMAPPAGELCYSNLYDTVALDECEATDGPNACYQSLFVDKLEGRSDVYSNLTETTEAAKSLYVNTGSIDVATPQLSLADQPPPPALTDLPLYASDNCDGDGCL